MKQLINLGAGILAVAVLALPQSAMATDQKRPVTDIIVVDVNGDLDGFLDRMQRIEKAAERLGLGAKLRVFQATFAGPKAGEVYLFWELPTFAAFADAETKLHEDTEFLKVMAEMEKAGQGFSSELLAIEVTKK